MKRLILSAFSMMLAAGALAPSAVAFPQLDPTFKVQTLRLSELDARNKSEYGEAPYDLSDAYDQTSTQATEWANPQNVTAEQAEIIDSNEPSSESAEISNEESTQSLSVAERRQQVLDRG